MWISLEETATLLKEKDSILILCHRSPDGDTIGTAMGLYYALRSLGKQAAVQCTDPFPENYAYLYPEAFEDFEPSYIVAVDVAMHTMLGALAETYPKIDLCIDHHPTNPGYAQNTLLVADAAAAGEIMLAVLEKMEIVIDSKIANALYTAISTDTGGLRFSSTSANTFFATGRLLQYGAEHIRINQVLFETKSRALVRLEALAMNAIQYYEDGLVAIMPILYRDVEKAGIKEEELDGIASLPRNIAGVGIGITVKEKADGECRISIRTTELYDANLLAEQLGGGGHKRAAGCRVKDLPMEQVIEKLIDITKSYRKSQVAL